MITLNYSLTLKHIPKLLVKGVTDIFIFFWKFEKLIGNVVVVESNEKEDGIRNYTLKKYTNRTIIIVKNRE